MNNDCRFCNIIKGNYSYPVIDKPFAESNSYIAIASIGAFIEGWTLIIPKKHGLSMKNHYIDNEFVDFFNTVSSKIYNLYGKAIAFEHSSACEGSPTACGSNHAHIHIVPFNSSLVDELTNDYNYTWQKVKTSTISEISNRQEYLFYSDLSQNNKWEKDDCYIHLLNLPVSQYFRKLLSKKTNLPYNYDYKVMPCMTTSRKTALELMGE